MPKSSPRPAARFAGKLTLEYLGLYVNLREMVLSEDHEQITALETLTGVPRSHAVEFFDKIHNWGSPEIDEMLVEAEARGLKATAIKMQLRSSLNIPILTAIPEA